MVQGEGYTLIEGDCLKVMANMRRESVDLIATSPPYNCRKPYGTFTDELSWDDYYAWMDQLLVEFYRLLVPGGVVAINIPGVIRWQADHKFAHTWSDFDSGYKTHRHGEKTIGRGRIEPIGFRVFEMMQSRDRHMREPIVWVKGADGYAHSGNYQMGCDSDPYLRSGHELILLGSKDRWFHRGGTGRRGGDAVPFSEETKDVWFIEPCADKHHPAVFPIEIPLRLIRLFTHAADAVIFDPFMGRGTTGEAALQVGRQFIGCEIDPGFFDVAQQAISDKPRAALGLPKRITGSDKDYKGMPLFMSGAAL